jgi:hypothetical protein
LKLDRHDYLYSVCISRVRAQLGPPLAGISESRAQRCGAIGKESETTLAGDWSLFRFLAGN